MHVKVLMRARFGWKITYQRAGPCEYSNEHRRPFKRDISFLTQITKLGLGNNYREKSINLSN
jgi:hypothetical protein